MCHLFFFFLFIYLASTERCCRWICINYEKFRFVTWFTKEAMACHVSSTRVPCWRRAVIVTHTRAHPRHPQVRMECSHTHPSLVIEHVPERCGESFTKVRGPLQLRWPLLRKLWSLMMTGEMSRVRAFACSSRIVTLIIVLWQACDGWTFFSLRIEDYCLLHYRVLSSGCVV